MSVADGGRGRTWLGLALAAVLAATALVYWPGLDGPLVFDDAPNIIDSPRLRMQTLDAQSVRDAMYAAFGHRPDRGLAHLSFALNYLGSGGVFVPRHMKLTNLAIHATAGLLLFWLSRRLARRVRPAPPTPGAGLDGADLLALLVTALWLLHPLQLTSVLYTVQRMTSLSALFVLGGVALFVAGRERLEAGRRGAFVLMLAGIAGGVGAGVLVKENAALLPAFTALVELVFFRRDGLAPAARRGVLALHGVFFGLPALAVLGVVALRFDLVEATYATRDFTPLERLLTEGRVLGRYLEMIALPRLSGFGLYHDDFAISRGLFAPPVTALAAAAWLAIAAAAAWGLARRAPWAFGIGWFLAGHAMESTLIGLELMHEHRNYLPLAGLLLGLSVSAWQLLTRKQVPRRAVFAVCVPVLALLAFLTHTRAGIWGSERSLIEFTATVHPQSYRAANEQALSRVWAGSPLSEVYAGWARAARLGRSDHTALLELIKLVSFASTQQLPEEAGDCAPRSTIALQMPASGRCMRELLEHLLAEMHRRAREEPIPSSTVGALEHFATCATSGTGYCEVLRDDVTSWVRTVLEQGRTRSRLRPRLTLLLADLRVSAGHREEALRLAEQATRDSGHGPSFTSQLVAIYLTLGEPAKARRAVARLTDPEFRRPGNAPIAESLSRAIDAHEREASR